ncbi:MAG TPA: response regulator [Blastocatellia bacterium]|nr:response regulator [Blastocatellia bacterium]
MAAKILIINGDLESRDTATIWLERAGYKVLVASEEKEWLSLIVAEAPDLVITDLQTPALGGIESIKRLRATAPAPRIIAIDQFTLELASEAIVAGANKVMAKPLDHDIMLAIVKSQLTPSVTTKKS